MRITDGLLIQQVGNDRLVVVDDNTGAEAVVLLERIPDIARDIHAAQLDAAPAVTVHGFDANVDIPRSAYPQAAFALGYFWGARHA
jgi:hypothetical protein